MAVKPKLKPKRPFIFEIQDGVLNSNEEKVFKELFMKYVNKLGHGPDYIDVENAADYTLSNCRDTATDCTCDKDD